MLPRLEISLDGREPIAEIFEKTRVAAENGATTVWLASHLFEQDPVSSAAVMLERFPTLDVVLMAISPLVLHPVQIAMSAATLDEMFPGRISVCLGVGSPDDLGSAGIDADKPLQAMKEALALCRALLSGDKVTLEGQRFGVSGRALRSGSHPVPLLMAASGPKMLELARSEADGVLLSAATSREFIKSTIVRLHAGKPSRPCFDNCGLVYVSVDDDRFAAMERLRSKLAVTLRGAHHAANLEAAGSKLDQTALRDAFSAGRNSEAAQIVPDQVVLNHSAAGTPTELPAMIQTYRDAGLDRVILSAFGSVAEIETAMKAMKTTERLSDEV